MKINTNKPLLLIFPFDLLSHYLRCLMLARHWKPYFEILFAHADKYVDFIRKEGYQTFACHSLNAAEVMEGVKKFDFSWINEEALETVYLDQVKIINILRPVAVIGDTSLTLKMAAEKTGVAYISLMNGYMSKYYSCTRKISRTHPSFRYMSVLPTQLLNLLTQKGEAVAFYRIHKPFKKIRLKYKLFKEVYYLDELEGDINLICDLADLFPQKALPQNYFIISPLYYDTNTRYAQIQQKLDRNKKTIFISMGSTGDWAKTTFINNPYFNRYNIIAAGDSDNVLHAAHIFKVSFVNIHEIFSLTDLVICHGGNGTVYQSLLYGIPLLCITNHFEQEWNVEALERLGAGRSLDNISKLGELINVVDEWITKKELGLNELYTTKIKDQASKLRAVIRGIAMNLIGVEVQEM